MSAGSKRRRVVRAGRVSAVCLLAALASARAQPPAWWFSRSVLDTNAAAEDFAAVNQGQVKWLASRAEQEFEARLPGGAGPAVRAAVAGFTSESNYLPVNGGQLKFLARPFYDRLWDLDLTAVYPAGVSGRYPWTEETGDDKDFAAANVGQVKYLFSFNLDTDSDGDTMPDVWEMKHGLDRWDPGDAMEDPDLDGFLNREEAQGHPPTDPRDRDSVPTRTLYVATNGTPGAAGTYLDPLDTIGEAVGLATADMRVVVFPGLHAGPSNRNIQCRTAGVIIKSLAGPERTIVDCERAGRGFLLATNGGVWGFTIRHGAMSNGGGILCTSRSRPTIRDCIVRDNDGMGYSGGGICCDYETAPTITHCAVVANRNCRRGGGIFCYSVSRPVIDRCTIAFNDAGGFEGMYSYAVISNSVLWSNNCHDGALDLFGRSASFDTIRYSCVEPGFAGTVAESCISMDPRLAPRGFRLLPDSPCVDAVSGSVVSVDIDGELRHDDPAHGVPGAWIDMGADELVDGDGDQMADAWERLHFGDLSRAGGDDFEGDGVSDREEYAAGTDPRLSDSDHDGLTDAEELQTYGTDAADHDSDGDHLTDGDEVLVHHTNPLMLDTDDDGLDDGYEVQNGLDPFESLPSSGVNRRWLYHGNPAYLAPGDERLPFAYLQRFFTGPWRGTNVYYILAPRDLALGSGETAEVGVRLTLDGSTQWVSAAACTTAIVGLTSRFHGSPTMGASRTLDVYRAEWTMTSFSEGSYCPYVRVRNGASEVIDEVCLLAAPDGAVGCSTNNWCNYPQVVGTRGGAAEYPITGSSLYMAICDAVDRRIEGRDSNTAIRIFSVQQHDPQAPVYVRNPDCWAADLDLTCISPWNSVGGVDYAGALVSPRHVYFAAHYPLPVGAAVRFVTRDNAVVQRTVMATRVLLGPSNCPDIGVALLDSDVDPAISFARVLPDNWSGYLSELSNMQLPALCLDKEEKALVTDVYELDKPCNTDYDSAVFTTPDQFNTPKRREFYEEKIGGDSGNPAFWIIEDQLVLLTAWTSGGAGKGTSVVSAKATINQMMADLGGGYQLTEIDLGGFPLTGAPARAMAAPRVAEEEPPPEPDLSQYPLLDWPN